MTLYWWMHWFWITYILIICILLTHSMSLSPFSTAPSNLDVKQNNSLPKPINLIDETTIPKPQTVPFTDTNGTYELSQNDSVMKPKTTVNSDPALCVNYDNNRTAIMNSTTELKNETRLLCNKKQVNTSQQIYSDSLQISTNVTLNESIDLDSKFNITTDFTNEITNNTTVIVMNEFISAKVSNSENISESSWNAMSITGLSFGIIICAVFIGVTSFILYRRRYLNKPQTLNDKCSNPDSSGYIDDSTMRENSEEMYSLDNDSFLNSLEAMTIQNYWTDSVKHTKL